MTKYIPYIDAITQTGAVGRDLSFAISIGGGAKVSVGLKTNKKKLAELADVPAGGTATVSIAATEKDKYSDVGDGSLTLSLAEDKEFEIQSTKLTIQGVGGDKEKSATFTLNFYVDLTYQAGSAGLDIIKFWEKFRPNSYPDAAGNPTIGYGHKINVDKEASLLTATWSEAAALEQLAKDVAWAEKAVNALVTVKITQAKFDALVSLVFNIGRGNFAKSDLLKVINAKGNKTAITKEWSEFRRSDGVIQAGLVKRRADELALYFS